MEQNNKIPHLIIAGPGQWGQQACNHALHRAVPEGGRVTIIVPRRYQHQFETFAPTFPGWANSPSVAAKIAELKSQNKPVHIVYDDHLSHLSAQLIEHRRSGRYLIAGYVATASEEHLSMAEYLSRYCHSVLIEKPISTVWEDLQSNGPFIALEEKTRDRCLLRCADHFLFRPGVSRSQTLSSKISLSGFLKRHAKSELHYEFRFCEPAFRDDPNTRLSAYKDGTVGDILIPHGLPPLLQLILPELVGKDQANNIAQNFAASVKNVRVRRWSAKSQKRDPHVAILAETAARMDFELIIKSKAASQVIHVHLMSVKGHSQYDRFFRVYAPLERCPNQFFGKRNTRKQALNMLKSIPRRSGGVPGAAYFGVSLGAVGCTIADFIGSEMIYQEIEGGHRSDQTRVATSEAANAHASMLDHLFKPDLDEDRRFMYVRTGCAITRFAIKTLHNAYSRKFTSYDWGKGIEEPDLEEPLDDKFRVNIVKLPNEGFAMEASRKATTDAEFDKRCRDIVKLIRNQNRAPRVISIIGPEGSGKEHVVTKLKKVLSKGRRPNERVECIEISQYLSWSPHPISKQEMRKFDLDVLIRSFAEKMGFVLSAGRSPFESLKELLSSKSDAAAQGFKLPPYLMVTGLSFIPDNHWPDLVSILALLPPDTRLLLFTSRNDRACGHILRVGYFIAEELAKAQIYDCWKIVHDSQHGPSRYPPHLLRIRKLLDGEIKNKTGRIRLLIERYSYGNGALMRLYSHMLYYISFPSILKELGYNESRHPTFKEQKEIDQIMRRFEQDLASVALPSTHIANPEKQLERLACFILGELQEEERVALYQLSLVPEPFTSEMVDAVLPSLFDRALQHQAVRVPFEFNREQHQRRTITAGEANVSHPSELEEYHNAPIRIFPEIRRVIREMGEPTILAVHADVTRQRLLLRRHIQMMSDTATPDTYEAKNMVEAFIRLNLSQVDLSGGAFLQLLKSLVTPLYSLDGATGNEPAMSLIGRLTRMEDERATNLDLLSFSKFFYLYSQAISHGAGANWAEANRGIKNVKRAYWIAEHIYEIEMEPDEAYLLALQGWRFARLRQTSCFLHLFRGHPIEAPQDEDWDNSGNTMWRKLIQQIGKKQALKEVKYELATALALKAHAFELLVDLLDKGMIQRTSLKNEAMRQMNAAIALLAGEDQKQLRECLQNEKTQIERAWLSKQPVSKLARCVQTILLDKNLKIMSKTHLA